MVLFSCAHNAPDNTTPDSTNIEIETNAQTETEKSTIDEAIQITSEASEIINAEYENDSPTYSIQGDRITIIDMKSQDTTNSNTQNVNEKEIITNFDPEREKKKGVVQTYITKSGKQVQSKEFNGPIDPESLKLKDIERERIEVKTTLIKPIVNAMYEPQTITHKQAKKLAKTMEDETVISNHNYTNKNIKDLMENYTNLIKTSSVCCVSTIASKLKSTGVNGEGLLNILKNDAKNFYVQDTCLILAEEDIDSVFGKTLLSSVVKDSRKSCICTNKKFIHKRFL